MDSESPFNVNDLVIAKVKGYPPWPAIVVTKDHLPEQIRESKPKSYETAPILFFNDNSFMWAAVTDLQVLENEVALKRADKPKTKKALREAYRMASEKPTIEQYLEMMANPPPVEEPPKKRAKKASEKPPAAPRASRASTKSIKRKLKEGPIDDLNDDTIELKRPKQRGRPSAARDAELASNEDLAASSELRAELCRQARFRLQKALLVDDPKQANFSSLNTILSQIEQVENIEIAIVRMSKLRRVLKAVIELEVEDEFKRRCHKLLERWETVAEPIVRGLPESEVNLEELKEREGTVERETEPPSDDTRDVTQEPEAEAGAEAEESKDVKEESKETESKEPSSEAPDSSESTSAPEVNGKEELKEEAKEEPKETEEPASEAPESVVKPETVETAPGAVPEAALEAPAETVAEPATEAAKEAAPEATAEATAAEPST